MNYLAVIGFSITLAASYLRGYMPLLIPVVYLILSALTLMVYARDKSAAQSGNWRIPEDTLHVLSLLCGWPGAALAQRLFRHKTRKLRFLVPFWLTIVVNCAVLVWLHTDQGSIQLNTGLFKAEETIMDMVPDSSTRIVLLRLLAFHV